jgi:hypothetical protein
MVCQSPQERDRRGEDVVDERSFRARRRIRIGTGLFPCETATWQPWRPPNPEGPGAPLDRRRIPGTAGAPEGPHSRPLTWVQAHRSVHPQEGFHPVCRHQSANPEWVKTATIGQWWGNRRGSRLTRRRGAEPTSGGARRALIERLFATTEVPRHARAGRPPRRRRVSLPRSEPSAAHRPTRCTPDRGARQFQPLPSFTTGQRHPIARVRPHQATSTLKVAASPGSLTVTACRVLS